MPDNHRTRASIRPVKERVEDELLTRPGVTAVDIGEKVSDGRPTGELSIVVYVDEKKPLKDLSDEELIPPEVDGVPTDVVADRIVLQSSVTAYRSETEVEPLIDTGKYTPVRGGISMGPCRSVYLEPPDVPSPGNYIFTGTFGAVVKDRTTDKPMALTNFHVACVDTTWSVGDTMAQPSRVDGGSCPSDRFGTLTRAVLSENVDGAVVELDAGVNHDCAIEEIGDVKGKTTATVGMVVRKRGRTTELTHGSVASTDVTVSVDYGNGLGVQTLKHQIRVVPDTAQNPRFSDQGDSGSVVVNGDNKVIGLLFAGTLSGSATFLNPIQAALDELDVDLCVKTWSIVTKPIICDSIVTKPVVCHYTKPVVCALVTRPKVCEILTTPALCEIRTHAACPPITLACGFDPGGFDPGRFDPARLDPARFDRDGMLDDSGGGPRGGRGYGDPAAAVDDAFWLGYYAALDVAAQAEETDGS